MSKPEAVLFPVSDWHPHDQPQEEGDLGPAVHHVYEVRRDRSRKGQGQDSGWEWRGRPRMNAGKEEIV